MLRRSRLPALLALPFLAVAGCDLLPTGSRPAAHGDRVPLTVILDPGVRLAEPLVSGEYPRDTVIEYAVRPERGTSSVAVFLDSLPAEPNGRFRLDGPRVLLVSARTPAPSASSRDPVAASLLRATESVDPAFSYQRFLDDVGGLVERVGIDSAGRHLDAVERWILADDARTAAFLRLSDSLAGEVFEWRGGHATLATPDAAADGDGAAPDADGAPGDDAPRSAVVFINGVTNSLRESTLNLHVLATATRAGVPALASPRARFLNVYNPSAPIPFVSENSCHRRFIAEIFRRPAFAASIFFRSRGAVEEELQCSFQQDHVEAALQVFDARFLRGMMQRKDLRGASRELVRTVQRLHAEGRVVAIVAHSQGNLMTTPALQQLGAPGGGTSLCTAYVGVAPPGRQDAGIAEPSGSTTIQGARVRDFVLLLFGGNGSELKTTALSDSLDAVSGAWWRRFPGLGDALALKSGIELHSFASSYLEPRRGGATRRWILGRLTSAVATLDRSCAGRFKVHARDAATELPIPGAVATVHQDGVDPTRGEAGTEDGVLSAPVPLRPATVEVTAPGYDVVRLSGKEPLPQATTYLGVVYLTRTGAGTGTVQLTAVDDGSGRGVAGVRIALTAPGRSVRPVTSDASGGVSVSARAGSYDVAVERSGYRLARATTLLVREGVTIPAEVRLVPVATASVAGTWSYRGECRGLGTIEAEADYEQEGARVTGSIRILDTRSGVGGWYRVEGAMVGRVLTGSGTSWIREGSWKLQSGWVQTVSADGRFLEGAAPTDECTTQRWARVQSRPALSAAPHPAGYRSGSSMRTRSVPPRPNVSGW